MVVGIDYDSYKATLCALDFDDEKPRLQEARFRRKQDTGEDAAVRALGTVEPTILNALALLGDSDRIEECVVWIERGYGQNRVGDWVLGAYFGAIYCAVEPVAFVNPLDLREWKRMVTAEAEFGLTTKGKGNGNAKKPIANEATRMLLARVGVDGSDWTPDQLDAYAIAWSARRLNEKALA